MVQLHAPKSRVLIMGKGFCVFDAGNNLRLVFARDKRLCLPRVVYHPSNEQRAACEPFRVFTLHRLCKTVCVGFEGAEGVQPVGVLGACHWKRCKPFVGSVIGWAGWLFAAKAG